MTTQGSVCLCWIFMGTDPRPNDHGLKCPGRLCRSCSNWLAWPGLGGTRTMHTVGPRMTAADLRRHRCGLLDMCANCVHMCANVSVLCAKWADVCVWTVIRRYPPACPCLPGHVRDVRSHTRTQEEPRAYALADETDIPGRSWTYRRTSRGKPGHIVYERTCGRVN